MSIVEDLQTVEGMLIHVVEQMPYGAVTQYQDIINLVEVQLLEAIGHIVLLVEKMEDDGYDN